jgi:hypothetical protein
MSLIGHNLSFVTVSFPAVQRWWMNSASADCRGVRLHPLDAEPVKGGQ